nr:gustatory receptor 5 [Pachyrhinus yasumatsui]
MKNYDPAENMTKYTNKVASTILIIAFAEHNILTYNKLMLSYKKYSSIPEVFKDYFSRVSYWDIFFVIEYSAWKGMICQVLNWQRTFIWTYTDVFIILIGISFCYKLKQIKGRIRNMVELKTVDIHCWRRVREDYVKLEDLFIVINRKLAWIFLVSFAANMFFILLQLYKLIKDNYTRLELMYLLISFFLLVGRLTCVCYFGGAPFTETMAIVKALNSVDASAYNIEVQRFITYIDTTEMIFTGMDFFKITQNLILKIASAIMAYELVMSQINEYTQ